MKNALLVALGALFATSVLAADVGDQGSPQNQQKRQARFQEKKQMLLEHMDKRISALQQAKSCVQKAQNPEALRDCRPEGHEKGERGEKGEHHERGGDKDKN
jgi:hypothetical protein